MAPDRTLFPPDFLNGLHALHIAARRVPAGGRPAEQASRARGSGIELTDLRPYAAGDEFRAIDWRAWQRLDRLFVRVFHEDRDLPLHFLVDRSHSMSVGAKNATALRTVAALAAVALQQMDRIAIHPFAEEAFVPLPGTSGKSGLARMLAYLEGLGSGTGTGLVEHLRRFAARPLRRGLCVLVSDLYDPRGLAPVLAALSEIRHRVLVVRPVARDEARPNLSGEVEVEDCETGESLALSVDRELLDRYESAYRAFEAELLAFATARGVGTATVRIEDPVLPQIAELFPRGVLAV